MGEPNRHSTYSSIGDRRTFLKSAGGVAATMGLAGCANLSGGSKSANKGEGDFSDVSFKFWDVLNTQTAGAKKLMEKTIQQFEKDTGATVKANWSGFGAVAGAKWQNNFSRGQYPPVLTFPPIAGGPFMEDSSQSESYFKPVSEWKDKLEDDVMSNLEWILPGYKQANAWKEKLGMDNKLHSLPMASAPQNPIVVRTDHMKEAGLDPEEDFPPKDHEHFLHVAKTLQKDGPGKVGFQTWGHKYDWYVHPNVLAGSKNIHMAGYMDERDYESVTYGSDAYRFAIRENIKLYKELGMGVEQTPGLNTEQSYGLFANGTISMAQYEASDANNIAAQAPDLYKSGNIKWGQWWHNDGDHPGGHNTSPAVALTVAPPNVDEKKWERKQEAAIELINRFFSKKFQSELYPRTGRIPMRRDVHESTIENAAHEEKNNAAQTYIKAGQNMPRVNTSHPKFLSVSTSVMAPLMQQGLRGKKPPEQIADEGAKKGNEILRKYWKDRGVSI